jgi:hypothetical protein
MKELIWKSIILGLSLGGINMDQTYAITDFQAMGEGMLPMESYMINEIESIVNPALNKEGVLRAAKSNRLVIAVNKSTNGVDAQTLTMFENGIETLRVKVSTGREKEELSTSGRRYFSTTPKGYFRPQKMYQDYLSYTWKAPMPNAVFIIGGIALHATTQKHFGELGKRASGGCIRLMPEVSLMIRKKIMDTGRGSRPGQYKVVNEDEGRNRISGNTVFVDGLERQTGDFLNEKIKSWDTVIVVYEE